MTRYVTRKVDIEDRLVLETLAAMNRECFSRAEWCGRIRPDRGDWWIVTCDGKEAAYAGMVPSVRFHRAGYLIAAAVLPAYRGHGLHKRLVKARIKQARAYGWTQLFTETINDNAHSANNLIECGFRQFKPDTPWGSPYAVYWRLKL